MNLDRRHFLGATPLIFGFSLLLIQDQQSASRPQRNDPEDPFALALAEMKRRNAPGIAFAVPKDDKAKQLLADTLNDLLDGFSIPNNALALRAVLVCLPESRMPAKEHENLVLLDQVGARAGGAQLVFGDTDRIIERLHELLDTYDDARRRACARETTAPGERELRELAAIQLDDYNAREPWIQKLMPLCVAGSHVIYRWRKTEHQAERIAAEHVIARAYGMHGVNRLPFGVLQEPLANAARGGRGGGADACLGCGMARLSRRSQYLLKFISK